MSQHIPLLVGAATAFTAMPAARGEWLSAVSFRRRPVDLTNCVRARLYQGGGTDGLNTSYLSVDYTTDLTGATGWASLCGGILPVVSSFDQGGTVHQVGPWSTIAVAARGLVLIRLVGAGGNGAAAPTFAHIGLEAAGAPRYAGQSLAGITRTTDVMIVGGSLLGGGGDVVEFGTLAVPDRVIPSGMTVLRGDAGGASAALAAFSSNAHGIEAGIAKRLAELGRASGVRLICRYVDATDAASWVTTHLATAAADATAVSATPCVVLYASAVSDAVSDTTVGNYDATLRAFRGRIQALWPGAGWIAISCPATDAVSFPRLAEAKAVLDRRLGEPFRGRQQVLDGTGIEIQPTDDTHPTSAGTMAMGVLFADALVAAGIL